MNNMSEEKKVDVAPAEEPKTTNEVEKRLNAFISDYKALVDKHQMDFAAFPMFIPDGQGGFKVIVQQRPVDITNQPKASPTEFMAK